MLMDLDALVQKYDMKINGVIHVGAHLAEEAECYQSLGITDVSWIEANPDVIETIRERVKPFGHRVYEALIYSEDSVEMLFHITNYDGMSSSVFQFGTHPTFSPDTVFVKTISLWSRKLDSLNLSRQANFLNMDLQGAELHALMGATRLLDQIDYIMMEVNREEVYIGCAQVGELDDFLVDFERVETYWVPGQGWGDGLWVRG